jgi:zinc D-Ala-D-Ala carboxypeptidase
MGYMDKISPYITYEEATHTNTGIENKPNMDQLRAMKLVARQCFDPVREAFGKPIRVNSFFRSAEVNTAIGGSATSQHCKGEAIDMDGLGGLTNSQIFNYIREHLTFDQLIHEGGTEKEPAWVHVSYSAKQNRNQVLRMVKENGKTKYIAMI